MIFRKFLKGDNPNIRHFINGDTIFVLHCDIDTLHDEDYYHGEIIKYENCKLVSGGDFRYVIFESNHTIINTERSICFFTEEDAVEEYRTIIKRELEKYSDYVKSLKKLLKSTY